MATRVTVDAMCNWGGNTMATLWQKQNGEEWGPWILHDGKGCPLQVGTIAEVVCEDRFGFTMRQVSLVCGGEYSSWNWTYFPELKRIIRYREKKPKGLQMLEGFLATKDTPKQRNLIRTE
jgi:hypothetical protein